MKKKRPKKWQHSQTEKRDKELMDAIVRLAFEHDLSVTEIVNGLRMNDHRIMRAVEREIQFGKSLQGNGVYSSGWQAL